MKAKTKPKAPRATTGKGADAPLEDCSDSLSEHRMLRERHQERLARDAQAAQWADEDIAARS